MKIIVITGSSKGIGLGMAEQFLKRGCTVVLSARHRAPVDKAVEKLAGSFGPEKVSGTVCDVNELTQLDALWAHAVDRFERVDIWINNAGCTTHYRPLQEIDPAQIAATVSTNLTGTMLGSQVALKGMLTQGFGQIYTMEGHGSDDMMQAGMSVYGATKRAIRYFTEALVEELADTPVQVGTLAPGMVLTDFLLNELRAMPPEQLENAVPIFNILADKLETVTPFLVQKILENDKNGTRVEWLNQDIAMERFQDEAYLERDILGEFGF
jgi:NAD(P)-dependent dehydrogenase (short-subunit alcohol dehydrogenase family)